ncbi:hypothetical protein L873DRAFT_120862 [Choiromyces venosus 120613-1]|uniref:Uncharacterized protein n=1 Tax=Choiromyces venosus 120613-1 TaxID=1336337 RepID=A0A3N4J4B1_9PEZI|nr:hypothetical protein L873DRAFT_120862 [Choiromyces venosus 120613-1]
MKRKNKIQRDSIKEHGSKSMFSPFFFLFLFFCFPAENSIHFNCTGFPTIFSSSFLFLSFPVNILFFIFFSFFSFHPVRMENYRYAIPLFHPSTHRGLPRPFLPLSLPYSMSTGCEG